MNIDDKTKRVLEGGAAVAALIRAEYDHEHQEYTAVRIAGVPVFKRDANGRPRVFGIPFGRWIRGPRKDT